ncbi:helix-turn-helix domain-containing protein [Paraburkholderia tropica]|uniref:helix-turn-helix domain-containing protein n=1 Tax=Paraburkholderia tropica TaxID=92647 RepID=UPI001617229C
MRANLLVHELFLLGLTQKEVERRSGVGQSVVSALKTGRKGRRIPYETVVSLERLRDEVLQERFAEFVSQFGGRA